MYKYYAKAGYHVMYYRFDSIYEFVEYLTSTPIKSDVFSSPSSIYGNYDFCQTDSFDEAIELLKYGYHQDFNKLITLKLKLEKYIKISTKYNKQYNYYVGYAPDVKAYLEGSPLSMLNKSHNLRKKVDIYMNSSFYGNTSKEAIFNRGAIVLTLIEILESLGFSVDFHLFEMSTVGSQLHYSDFVLKKENERLNPQKLFFPLCHPSWIRRLNFRLIEVTPNVTEYWAHSYGKPSDLDTMEQIIDLKSNDIIIPTINELGIKGQDLVDDTNSVFDYINTLSDKDFELKPVEKVKRM